jgi:hypothetical protein
MSGEAVRDKRFKKSEFKGHTVVAGSGGRDCPCLPCYNCHDCGRRGGDGKWTPYFDCAYRYSLGCPSSLKPPTHIFRWPKTGEPKPGMVRVCLRCGQPFRIGGGRYNMAWVQPGDDARTAARGPQ